MKAPFPYFGGKSRAANLVWPRLGDVRYYIEPFCGSAAMLLERPLWHKRRLETINDADGFVVNFWRAISAAPDETARFADYPITESDLYARHCWLTGQRSELTARLEADPEFYDAKVAGWWAWGLSMWMGDDWCPAQKDPSHKTPITMGAGGVHQQLPAIMGGRGVNAGGDAPHRMPTISGMNGVHKRMPTIGGYRGVQSEHDAVDDGAVALPQPPIYPANGGLYVYFRALAERLRKVQVVCGDWARPLGCPVNTADYDSSVGVFLDPPYGTDICTGTYAVDVMGVAQAARQWALEHGTTPGLRIALCGYYEQHAEFMPADWRIERWSATGGFGNTSKTEGSAGKANRHRETIWFSPHCLQPGLFDE